MAKELEKRVARFLLGDYSLFAIFRSPALADDQLVGRKVSDGSVREVHAGDPTAANSALWQAQSWYAGYGAHSFVALAEGKIVGVCFYWFGERYMSRNFWPLAAREAKLVQIVVDPVSRGRGVAVRLISESLYSMKEHGFERCYARIWHSNHPSIRAFEKSGWTRIATVFECVPLGFGRRRRFVFRDDR